MRHRSSARGTAANCDEKRGKEVRIKVNGTRQEIKAGLSVAGLLVRNNVEQPDMVSAHLNGEFVQREHFVAAGFHEGDEVDFLYFMGGGR